MDSCSGPCGHWQPIYWGWSAVRHSAVSVRLAGKARGVSAKTYLLLGHFRPCCRLFTTAATSILHNFAILPWPCEQQTYYASFLLLPMLSAASCRTYALHSIDYRSVHASLSGRRSCSFSFLGFGSCLLACSSQPTHRVCDDAIAWQILDRWTR